MGIPKRADSQARSRLGRVGHRRQWNSVWTGVGKVHITKRYVIRWDGVSRMPSPVPQSHPQDASGTSPCYAALGIEEEPQALEGTETRSGACSPQEQSHAFLHCCPKKSRVVFIVVARFRNHCLL